MYHLDYWSCLKQQLHLSYTWNNLEDLVPNCCINFTNNERLQALEIGWIDRTPFTSHSVFFIEN